MDEYTTQDYDLSAVFMRNWDTRDESGTDSGCEWKKDWEDMQRVCRMLGLKCQMVSFASMHTLLNPMSAHRLISHASIGPASSSPRWNNGRLALRQTRTSGATSMFDLRNTSCQPLTSAYSEK